MRAGRWGWVAVVLVACGTRQPNGEPGSPCDGPDDCNRPWLCAAGYCRPNQPPWCLVGTRRCAGRAVERCAKSQDRWERVPVQVGDRTLDECPLGCFEGLCTPLCDPGELRCEQDEIYRCLHDGKGWTLHEACPTTCVAEPGPPAAVSCAPLVCVPWTRRCKAGAEAVLETCEFRGLGWREEACPPEPGGVVCADGRCQPRACTVERDGTGTIVARQERCYGPVRERCNDTGTGWVAFEVCEWTCAVEAGVSRCEGVD